MKFYRDKYPYVFWYKIKGYKLTTIYYDNIAIIFFLKMVNIIMLKMQPQFILMAIKHFI